MSVLLFDRLKNGIFFVHPVFKIGPTNTTFYKYLYADFLLLFLELFVLVNGLKPFKNNGQNQLTRRTTKKASFKKFAPSYSKLFQGYFKLLQGYSKLLSQ